MCILLRGVTSSFYIKIKSKMKLRSSESIGLGLHMCENSSSLFEQCKLLKLSSPNKMKQEKRHGRPFIVACVFGRLVSVFLLLLLLLYFSRRNRLESRVIKLRMTLEHNTSGCCCHPTVSYRYQVRRSYIKKNEPVYPADDSVRHPTRKRLVV